MRIINRTFADDEVVLDFHHFDGCTFQNCKLVFHGYGPVGLETRHFIDCTWAFSGAAAHTVQFMTDLYRMGGGATDLIETTFGNIRGA